MNTKTKQEKFEDAKFRAIAKIFRLRGITVRRENLARGHAFRVKSGDCYFSGDKVLFVDRRLPFDQQISVLADHVVELGLHLHKEELAFFPKSIQSVLSRPSALPRPAEGAQDNSSSSELAVA